MQSLSHLFELPTAARSQMRLRQPQRLKEGHEHTLDSMERLSGATILLQRDESSLSQLQDDTEYSDYLCASLSSHQICEDNVVYYEMEMRLNQSSWKIYRRYSEFRAIRRQLLHLLQKSPKDALQCSICAHIFDSLRSIPFPSRSDTWVWPKLCLFQTYTSKRTSKQRAIILNRQEKLQKFANLALCVVRELRQHQRILQSSSDCQVIRCLMSLEEFFGITYDRYSMFLHERGLTPTTQAA